MPIFFVIAMAMSSLPCAPSVAPSAPSPTGILLRYDRPLGQVSCYHLSIEARGNQICLGETLPVEWRAEIQLTEEVIARGADGAVWLRLRGKTFKVTDATGVLAAGMPLQWPEVQIRMHETGELIDVSPASGASADSPRRRGFLTALGQLAPVVLSRRPIEEGDDWLVQTNGSEQHNRLVSITKSGENTIAQIESTGHSILSLNEASFDLGIDTELTGETNHSNSLDLLLDDGTVIRNKGEIRIRTNSETMLDRPEGTLRVPIQSNITITFDSRLVMLDGKSIAIP